MTGPVEPAIIGKVTDGEPSVNESVAVRSVIGGAPFRCWLLMQCLIPATVSSANSICKISLIGFDEQGAALAPLRAVT